MALGMTEKEATGEDLNPATSLFDGRDFSRMQNTVKLRKEFQELGGKLGTKPFKKKKGGGFRQRQQQTSAVTTAEVTDSSRQTEEKSTPANSANKSSKSTPTKKGRGEGK